MQTIACQQVLQQDASVFSIQWTDLPASVAVGLSADMLFQRYLEAVQRQTAGLVRPRQDGVRTVFLLLGRYPLLEFTAEGTADDGNGGDCRSLQIVGGVLVQSGECTNGRLLFSTAPMQDGTVRVTLQLMDYCPLLLGTGKPSWFRRWLYRLTQAALHRLVTVRFLAGLYRELTGSGAYVRVVKVQIREGLPT